MQETKKALIGGALGVMALGGAIAYGTPPEQATVCLVVLKDDTTRAHLLAKRPEEYARQMGRGEVVAVHPAEKCAEPFNPESKFTPVFVTGMTVEEARAYYTEELVANEGTIDEVGIEARKRTLDIDAIQVRGGKRTIDQATAPVTEKSL